MAWTASAADSLDDAPTSYVLEAGTTPGATNVARLNVGNATVYRVEITSGTYYVRVRAQNANAGRVAANLPLHGDFEL